MLSITKNLVSNNSINFMQKLHEKYFYENCTRSYNELCAMMLFCKQKYIEQL